MTTKATADDAALDEAYRTAARELHGVDGECEIDEGAIVSHSDDGGAYVAAWVWVYRTDLPNEFQDEEDDNG